MLKAVKANGLVHQNLKKNINNQKSQKHETFEFDIVSRHADKR